MVQNNGNNEDLLEFTDANATQNLDEIRTGNDIQFTFRTTLYDEWSDRYFQRIHANELINELETDPGQEQQDIDDEIILISSNIDFDSVERSSRILVRQITAVICDTFDINVDESRTIQQSLRYYGYLDGNTTI